MQLFAASIVAERLELLPPRSPRPKIIAGPILATADQWSE